MTVNHDFIREFTRQHGHVPWLICGHECFCLLSEASECAPPDAGTAVREVDIQPDT